MCAVSQSGVLRITNNKMGGQRKPEKKLKFYRKILPMLISGRQRQNIACSNKHFTVTRELHKN
jgi:hypothetical protein